MSKIAKQLTELVGNTPLLELNKFSQAKGLETPVIAKVEFYSPVPTPPIKMSTCPSVSRQISGPVVA